MKLGTNEIDFKSILIKYIKQWKWFALSAVLSLTCAFFYLRYSIPEYQASAKVQIIEEKGVGSELSVLKELDIFSGSTGNTKIVDEIEILNSRSNYISTIKELKLNLRYFIKGNIRDTEIYGKGYPFTINFLAPDSITNKIKHDFFIKILSGTDFLYSEEEEDNDFKKYSFGSKIETKIGDIILLPESDLITSFYDKKLKISISPIPNVVDSYRSKIKMGVAGEFSNIINVSLTDSKKQRAIDIINNLIYFNNKSATDEKRQVADKTSEFINDRIAEIYNNLSSVDQSAESFKESRGIADLGSQSNVNFQQSAASQSELQNANIQLNIANSMSDLIDSQAEYDIIPEVGLSDQGISSAAQRYNALVAERNRLLKSSNEKNPVIVKVDQQLESLKKGMQSSLNNVTNNLNLQVNSLSKQLSRINSRIYAAPSAERALRDISRKQQTTESLYLYLLQKREESQITFASASPKSRVIDSAYGSMLPVSPKTKLIYLAALVLGVFLPFSIIYINDLLDNKVHNKNGLENIVGDSYPVLAEMPRISKKESKLVSAIDRSVLSESLRILRTNLDYILNSGTNSGKGKVVIVSSSVPGEGKTFLSSNLAMIFASTKKKVLLLGADIRNPKLYNFYSDLKDKNKSLNKRRSDINGLTEYLFNDDVNYKDIITSLSVNENEIDIIYSGAIPPNPSELLMHKRLRILFEAVKDRYDYIIVDSAPLLVVTDTLLISKYADHIIYVTKAGFTEEKVLQHPIRLLKEGKLKNLSFVVNSVKSSSLGYGGKYGYGYGKKNKKWWQFFSKN